MYLPTGPISFGLARTNLNAANGEFACKRCFVIKWSKLETNDLTFWWPPWIDSPSEQHYNYGVFLFLLSTYHEEHAETKRVFFKFRWVLVVRVDQFPLFGRRGGGVLGVVEEVDTQKEIKMARVPFYIKKTWTLKFALIFSLAYEILDVFLLCLFSFEAQ